MNHVRQEALTQALRFHERHKEGSTTDTEVVATAEKFLGFLMGSDAAHAN